MNYDYVDGKFIGIMPDGSTTEDEDEFYDAWADRMIEDFTENVRRISDGRS